MTARDDALGEIAAAMHTPPLQREIPITIEAEDHIDPVYRDGNDVARTDIADLRNRAPTLVVH